MPGRVARHPVRAPRGRPDQDRHEPEAASAAPPNARLRSRRYAYDRNGDVARDHAAAARPDRRGSAATVQYVRNAVGDPDEITDPRGRDDPQRVLRHRRPASARTGRAGGRSTAAQRSSSARPRSGSASTAPEIPTTSGSGDFGSVNGVEPARRCCRAPAATTFGYDRRCGCTLGRASRTRSPRATSRTRSPTLDARRARAREPDPPAVQAAHGPDRRVSSTSTSRSTATATCVSTDGRQGLRRRPPLRPVRPLGRAHGAGQPLGRARARVRAAPLDSGDTPTVTDVTYDANGNRKTVTDPRDETTECDYDRSTGPRRSRTRSATARTTATTPTATGPASARRRAGARARRNASPAITRSSAASTASTSCASPSATRSTRTPRRARRATSSARPGRLHHGPNTSTTPTATRPASTRAARRASRTLRSSRRRSSATSTAVTRCPASSRASSSGGDDDRTRTFSRVRRARQPAAGHHRARVGRHRGRAQWATTDTADLDERREPQHPPRRDRLRHRQGRPADRPLAAVGRRGP